MEVREEAWVAWTFTPRQHWVMDTSFPCLPGRRAGWSWQGRGSPGCAPPPPTPTRSRYCRQWIASPQLCGGGRLVTHRWIRWAVGRGLGRSVLGEGGAAQTSKAEPGRAREQPQPAVPGGTPLLRQAAVGAVPWQRRVALWPPCALCLVPPPCLSTLLPPRTGHPSPPRLTWVLQRCPAFPPGTCSPLPHWGL